MGHAIPVPASACDGTSICGRLRWSADMSVVFTIGYEGVDLDSFLNAIEEHGIDLLVDIRLNPISRKRGFSKRQLAAAVEARGISYAHYPHLGCPADIRAEYALTGDFGRYTRIYQARVLSRRLALLARVARVSRARRVCLLCFEADANRCHRSLVAASAARLNQSPAGFYHLAVPSSGRTSPVP